MMLMRADRKRWMTFWMLFGFNALYYIPGATFSAYISVYYQSKGMSVSQIGLLSAMGPLLAQVMQPAWGMLSDRTGKHMAVLRIALLGAAGGVLCYYRADTFWLFAACILIY